MVYFILERAFVNVYLLYVVLRYFNLHRATPSEEQMGLDWSVHKELAYNFSDFEKSNEKIDKLGIASCLKKMFKPIEIKILIGLMQRSRDLLSPVLEGGT